MSLGAEIPALIVPDPARSTMRDRQAFMARHTRLWARDIALEHVLTAAKDNTLRLEHLDAVIGFGLWCKATNEEIRTVANVEWARALEYSTRFLDVLRRKLWPMCRSGMPEDAIIAAADALMFEWGVCLGDELLLPLLKGIWVGAQPRRGAWRGPR